MLRYGAMGIIGKFFRGLWRLAKIVWPFAGSGQMFGGAGTLWTFLFFLCCIVFAVAWLFGFSPSEVTAWLDAHADLWNVIGGWLWRGFWAVVLLFCGLILFSIGLEWFGQKAKGFEDSPRDVKGGCCALIAIVVVGYIAWIAITMPLE